MGWGLIAAVIGLGMLLWTGDVRWLLLVLPGLLLIRLAS